MYYILTVPYVIHTKCLVCITYGEARMYYIRRGSYIKYSRSIYFSDPSFQKSYIFLGHPANGRIFFWVWGGPKTLFPHEFILVLSCTNAFFGQSYGHFAVAAPVHHSTLRILFLELPITALRHTYTLFMYKKFFVFNYQVYLA